jgi:hypothetical protein
MEFDGGKKYAEVAVRFWISNSETEDANGNLFYGSEGYLAISGYTKYQFFMGRKKEPGPSGEAPTRHYENFIKAVRSRKTTDQNGPVETAHYAAGMAHLGNIALMRGNMLEFDPAKNRFTNDEEANKMLGQQYRKGFEVPPPNKV